MVCAASATRIEISLRNCEKLTNSSLRKQGLTCHVKKKKKIPKKAFQSWYDRFFIKNQHLSVLDFISAGSKMASGTLVVIQI